MQQDLAMEETRGNQFPGERFCPMEDELVLFYLKPMLSGEKVPGRNSVVFDCDLYGHQEPWEIWDAYKTRRPNDLRLNKDIYFFTQHKTMSSTDTRIRRTVGNGTWKGDDSGKPVKSLETGRVVGLKKRLTYKNQASEHNGCWILYEFYLDPSLTDNKQKAVKDYVLCLLRKNGEPKTKIKKKRKQREEEEVLACACACACDDGENTNKEQEELLEPQAKRQQPSEENVPPESHNIGSERQQPIDQNGSVISEVQVSSEDEAFSFAFDDFIIPMDHAYINSDEFSNYNFGDEFMSGGDDIDTADILPLSSSFPQLLGD